MQSERGSDLDSFSRFRNRARVFASNKKYVADRRPIDRRERIEIHSTLNLYQTRIEFSSMEKELTVPLMSSRIIGLELQRLSIGCRGVLKSPIVNIHQAECCIRFGLS